MILCYFFYIVSHNGIPIGHLGDGQLGNAIPVLKPVPIPETPNTENWFWSKNTGIGINKLKQNF